MVGLKPTVGLVSRAGAVGGSRHKDTIGPITRTVRDGAALLNAIAGAFVGPICVASLHGMLTDFREMPIRCCDGFDTFYIDSRL